MLQFPLPPALAAEFKHVEQIVLERTHSRAAVISVAGSHILSAGSTWSHAALTLMAAQTGAYQRERVAHAAAAVELIHAATQTHDDLVDEAERRRGTSRSGEWGHGVTLMVGNYFFALAAGEMALSPDSRVIGYYAHAVARITEETLAPAAPLRPLEEGRARHLERLSGAAGALYGAACKAGGACGSAPSEQIEALERFGCDLGMALRLGDEALDFAAHADGEAPGASLRAGAVTLPLIFAAAHSDGDALAAALDNGDPGAQAWAVTEVRRYGLAPTRAEIARLAAQARVALTSVPPGDTREALARVADYAVSRSA
jgi:geranylgeranyl pyrophosphate synthase